MLRKEVLQMNDEYITVAEAALLVPVTEKTVRRWFNEGRLTRYRVGVRGVRVRRSELDKLITPVPVPVPARKEAVL